MSTSELTARHRHHFNTLNASYEQLQSNHRVGLQIKPFDFVLQSCVDNPSASPARDISAIRHAVFLIKENRTFDNYFGTFPGADGVTMGNTSNGTSVPLLPAPDSDPLRNLCNSWDCAMLAMNGGLMNRFDLIGSGLAPYTQVTEQEIPNYWEYARNFALADHYFASIHGPSLPNYLYVVAASSGGIIDNGTSRVRLVADWKSALSPSWMHVETRLRRRPVLICQACPTASFRPESAGDIT